jgi:parvulin-like peptidyl-prolyl isomerase
MLYSTHAARPESTRDLFMKTLRFLLPFAALLALVAAGCGGNGGTADLGEDDVAVVGECEITKGELNTILGQAKRSYKAQNRAFPKQGTREFKGLRSQALDLLVTSCQYQQKAEELDVKVADKDVKSRLDQIKEQYFQGNEKRYQEQIKQQGITDAQVRRDIRNQLLSERIFKKVTTQVKVGDAEIEKYYKEHPTLYTQPETRDVRHVLVAAKQKSLAVSLRSQLAAGGSWKDLAKKHSLDPGSKDKGGETTIARGQTVPEFDKTSFELKVKEISQPVKTQYGWHVIQALSPIRPKKTTPLAQVKEQIRQQLQQQKRNDVMTKWVEDTKREFCDDEKIKYAAGYKPTPDPCVELRKGTTGATTGTVESPATTDK